MNSLTNKHLAFRLISAYVLIIVLVLSAYTFFSISREQRKVRSELANKGRLLVGLLSYNARVGVFAENRDLLKDVAAGITTEPDVVQVSLYNADGHRLYVVGKTASGQPAPAGTGPVARQDRDEILLRETDNALEFTKPVVLRSFPSEEQTLYFGERGANAAARIIGYARVVMGKKSMNRESLNIVLQNAVMALVFIGASILIVLFRVRSMTRPLETLTQRVRTLGREEEVDRVPVETGDEIGRLATAFNTMLDERRAAEQARQKILMDIHDGIGGITTNISLLSEIARKSSTPDDVMKALNTISDLSREGMTEIRSLMYSLDKSDLTWQTMSAELRNQGTKSLEPHAIAFEMTSEVGETAVMPGSLLCLHLFRIYREALTNVVKHAKATKVFVNLRIAAGRLILTVRDDGRGYDEIACPGRGRGVANMKARAGEIGGTVTLVSYVDKGTTVVVEVPLESEAR